METKINNAHTSDGSSGQSTILESNKAYAERLWLDLQNGNMTAPISTGFPSLDQALGGGLIPGLYVIGGHSSLGKTTFIGQMSDSLAYAGYDIIYVSLEMVKKQLTLKSISRLTYTLSENFVLSKSYNDLTNCNIISKLSAAEKDMIKKAFKAYAEYSDRVYFMADTFATSVDHIKAAVVTHKKCTGRTPIVIIDYIQILKGANESFSEKQALDYVVTTLKRMANEEDVIILAISSLNRSSYNSPISMEAYKESGGIEYTADVLIGLQPLGIEQDPKHFDMRTFKRQDIREMELVILKNRFGPVEQRVEFSYCPRYNYFEEL